MNCSEFYALRDRRTREYAGERATSGRPIKVVIGIEAGASLPGQTALLALANLLSRSHNRISFEIPNPDQRLVAWSPFGGDSVGNAVLNTVRRIDPCGQFEVLRDHATGQVALGIGDLEDRSLDFYVGADRAIAALSRNPAEISCSPGTVRGAALAACLGASAIFRSEIGRSSPDRRVSSWNYAEGDLAALGPEDLQPLNVGRVLMIGAGAVASCLVYWLRVFGVGGSWFVLDKDVVELHNTNRSLLFVPDQSAWEGGDPMSKAQLLKSQLPDAEFANEWYDSCATTAEHFDVVLPLANERDVRSLVASRSFAVCLHATTGENWLSQLHRHIAGKDDCIACRTAGVQSPTFGCSSVVVNEVSLEVGNEGAPQPGERSDAALSFLSAASGLMLATALQRLQEGDLAKGGVNDWRWDFNSPYRMATEGRRACLDDCRRVAAPNVRAKLNSHGIWASLDPG